MVTAMRRPQTTRVTAAGLVILLLALTGPHLAGAITGTGSHDTGTGGDKPTAVNPEPGGPLEPESVTPDGKPGNGNSCAPTFGTDAPDVVSFVSDADDLTPDDGNGHSDVFLNDGGVLDRVSTDPPGGTLTDVVAGPSLSSTGEVVGYGAQVKEDGVDVPADRALVVNRQTGAVEPAPPPRNGGALDAVAVSPDGSTVAWEQGGNLYVHQLGSGAPEPVLVTRDSSGRPAGGSSQPGPDLCPQGPGTQGPGTQGPGTQGPGTQGPGAQGPGLCAQGQRVVFASDSPSLVPGDVNGTRDVFVATGLLTDDPADDQVTRISRAYDGGEADGASTDPSITPDCTKVVFTSFATDLVPDDTNGTADVFVHDLTTGTTTEVSKGNGPSGQGSISDDGGYVAFASAADDLVPDDHNGADPRNATPTSFQAVDRSGALTYATSVLSVDGPRVRVGFPATLDFARLSAGSVDNGALIDEQVLPVGNRDGRSNTNSLATRGPTTFDANGTPVGPGADLTDGPDLSSAEVVLDDAGTPDPADDVPVVRYCFDKPVAGILGRGDSAGTDKVSTDRFLVEGYNSAVRLRSIKASVEPEVQINQVDGGSAPPPCVRASFAPGVEVDRFVGAAVLPAAVVDRDKRANVKGSIPLAGNVFDPQDGDVTGPNLRSGQADVVGNRVTYQFDDIEVTDALLSDVATRFGFVDADGILHPGRFVTAADQAAESVTVEFDVNSASVANVRRFVVLPGAVRNAGGEPNVEQSTDGDVPGPELLAVTRVGPVGAPGPPSFDFVFNTDVRQEDVAKFVLYTEDGTAFPAASLLRPSPRVVRVSAPAVERFPESMVLGVAQPAAVYERLVPTPAPQPPGQRLSPRANGEFSGAPNPLGAKGITRRFSPEGSITDGPDLIGLEPHPELHAVDFVFDEPVRDVHLELSRNPPDLPTDVFVRELATGDLVRASVDGDNRELDGSSFSPHISGDGRFVVFSFSAFLHGGTLRAVILILRRDLLVAQVTPRAIDFGDVATGAGGSDPITVEVANRGFGQLVIRTVALAGADPDDFKVSSKDCSGRILKRKQVCVMSATFAPGVEGDRAGDVVVTDNALGSPRAVSLAGRGFLEGLGPFGVAPVLTVSPVLGPPGTVALVRGEGFRPGIRFELRWAPAPGSTNTASPLGAAVAVTTDQFGAFGPTPLLVLPGDVLGPRLVEAQGDQPGAVAAVPFLVVPGTFQPEATPTRVTTGFGDALQTLIRRLHLVSRR
jgi:hypothetical protein